MADLLRCKKCNHVQYMMGRNTYSVNCHCQTTPDFRTYKEAADCWNTAILQDAKLIPMPPPKETPPPAPSPLPPDKSYIDDQGNNKEVELSFDITCRKCGGVAHIKILTWYDGYDGSCANKEVYILCDECENSQEIT